MGTYMYAMALAVPSLHVLPCGNGPPVLTVELVSKAYELRQPRKDSKQIRASPEAGPEVQTVTPSPIYK